MIQKTKLIGYLRFDSKTRKWEEWTKEDQKRQDEWVECWVKDRLFEYDLW